MSLWSRIVNVLRGDRLTREIEEELESHVAEAIEQGCDPSEARKALGPALRHREQSRDFRTIVWLDSLRADRVDLTCSSDGEMEKASRQFVSGWMFQSFGLQPAVGRLLTENDDLRPGAHPYAVLSYDYWRRRFGQDPKVVGRSFRIGNDVF